MKFSVTILGSNSANFAYGRHQTSQIVHYHNKPYLIDCGEGTQIRFIKHKHGIGKLKQIFISHLHGDHYFGLIGLISSLHLTGRTDELTIYGPPGLDEILTVQLKYSDTRLNYPLNFVPLAYGSSEEIFEDEYLKVFTIPLEHRIPCNGFLFQEKDRKRNMIKERFPDGISIDEIKLLKTGENVIDENGDLKYGFEEFTTPAPPARSYAYCSDTRYTENILPVIKGANLLYHESTFESKHEQRAMATFHSTAHHAAEIAKKGEVSKLLLGHYSSRYKELDFLQKEAQTIFPNSYLSVEGKEYQIESE